MGQMSPAPEQAAPASATAVESAPALCWSVHLLREQPDKAKWLAASLLATLVLGLVLFHSLLLAMLPVMALALSLSEWLFPIRYTLTDTLARAQNGLTTLEMTWRDVRHAYLADDGIKLSPLRGKNSRFESLRGIFLRFGEDNAEQVKATVKHYLDEARAHA